MALILARQLRSHAAFLAFVLFLGKTACQNLDCPHGIVNITAASGNIAYPGSSNTYGANETKCWKIQVPDIYEGIGVYYNVFDIEQCDDCACDRLTFVHFDKFWDADGEWIESKHCGRQTSLYLDFLRFVDGDPAKKFRDVNEVYLRFSSDDSVNYKGFNISFIAKIDSSKPQSFLNASENETIEFATRKFGVKSYPADYEEEWFLIVPSGLQVQITFEAFELEQSENCKNAFVAIRETYREDGPYDHEIDGDFGSIIAEPLCGNSLPEKIQSVGNMAWVKFKSTKNVTTSFKGFKASFKAVGQANTTPEQGHKPDGSDKPGAAASKPGQCCDCKCAVQSGRELFSSSSTLVCVLIFTVLMITYK